MEPLPATLPVRPAPIETIGVLEQMSDAFYLLDADWRFQYVNAQACMLLITTPDALLGTRIWDAFPEMDDTILATEYRRAMLDGVPVAFDVDDQRLGGWFRIRAYPSPAGLAVYIQDISARRAAHDRMIFQARLLDAVEQAVIVTDINTIVLYWNQYAETLYGWTAEEANGRPLGDLIVPAHNRVAADAIREQQEQRKPWSGEFELVDKSGEIVPVHVTSSPVFDDDGRCIGSIGISSDIRGQRRAQVALSESESRYRTLVEHMPAVTYTETTRDGLSTVYTSPQIEVLTGYTQETWGASSDLWLANIHPDDREHVLAELARTDATGDPFRVEYRFACKDGRIIWIRSEATLSHDQPGQARTWQGYMVDITERKQHEAQLVHAAFHDTLTQLPNRALFLERTRHALAGMERRSGKVGVLFLDLDNFKVINDTFGHGAGDEVLIGVANLIQAQLRKGETLTRLGGDEFAILLEDIDVIDDGVRVAQRLMDALEEPIVLVGREVVLEASIGIVISSERHKTPEELLRDADIALYRAKAASTRGYAVFEVEMHAAVTQRQELEAEMLLALERNEFVLHYQPIIELATGQLVGVEALIRWQHPERGLLSPAAFFPIAEQSGLIMSIGAWALGEACSQGANWCRHFRRLDPLTVSVNLSTGQFTDVKLTKQIATILAETGLDPACLTLELTETHMMDDVESTIEQLRSLKSFGVGLNVDNFGTGYSSLANLKRFPVDSLKIDQSFVRDIESEPKDIAIVSAMIALGHALGLRVVADGIETASQLELLRHLNCDLAQGHYVSDAVPPDVISSMRANASAGTRDTLVPRN